MAKASKPNILVIWGDDIGISNLSCYSEGLMGYRTPNIDRVAKEGMRFTDSYGEQSCTAGRASFITGQSCYRTRLSKVGVRGSPVGLADFPQYRQKFGPRGVIHSWATDKDDATEQPRWAASASRRSRTPLPSRHRSTSRLAADLARRCG